MPEIKTIKIKKLFTGVVLTGIVENDKTIERFVKPDEIVTVQEYVLPKLDALKEAYEVIKDSKTAGTFESKKPGEVKP